MRVRSFIYLFFLIGSLGGLAVMYKQGHRANVRASSVKSPARPASVTSAKPGMRPVYPFSIVPGGVGSREELKAAMNADRLVAAHYAGVEVDRLKPVTLARDLSAYVSFRMHGKVYWTSRKVRLAKGERVFQGGTPGAIGVRERCGNQVSEQPRSPVLPDVRIEPSSAILDTPDAPKASPAAIANASTGLAGPPEQASAVESGSPQMPVGGVGPGVFQAGGGGGGGGVFAGGGGGGGGGGGTAAPGQPAGNLPDIEYVSPGGLPLSEVIPPVAPPINYATVPAPTGPAPTGVNTVWYTLPPTQILPPSTTIPPAVRPCCQWMLTPPPGRPGVPEGPPVIPPSGPPVIITTVPPDITPLTPRSTLTTPAPPMPAVPEPSTWLMLGIGLALVLIGSRSRKPRA